VLCGAAGQPPALDLCGGCQADLPAPLPTQVPAGVRSIIAAYAYEPPVDLMVQALKYRGDLAMGRVLGSLLARRLAQCGTDAVDLLLPMPLHPLRLASRGFNQSQELARWVARDLKLPVAPTIATRSRAGRPQVGLQAAERQSNIRGAFAVTGEAAGRCIAIVDDVVTTGSTAGELAGRLMDAGAAAVDVWCVAGAVQSHAAA
jgi:ComF family protein